MVIYSKNKFAEEFESNTIKEVLKNEQKENLRFLLEEEHNEQPEEDFQKEPREDSQEQPQEDSQEQPQENSQEQPQENSQEQPQENSQEQPQENSQEQLERESSESNSQNETLSSEKICRICYDDQKEEKLISPCKCSGSVQWVHHSCLQKWIDISHKNECSTCKYTYQYQKKYKRSFYKHLDHSYVPKVLTIVFILITTIMSGLISKLLMKLLKFNNKIKIGFNLKYLFFSLKYFSLLFFVFLPIFHYLKIINIREVYNNYISLYERNNTVYGQGVSDISIFIYLTIYKFFEKNINKLTESEKVIMSYVPEKKNK